MKKMRRSKDKKRKNYKVLKVNLNQKLNRWRKEVWNCKVKFNFINFIRKKPPKSLMIMKNQKKKIWLNFFDIEKIRLKI